MKAFAKVYSNILPNDLLTDCIDYLQDRKNSGDDCFTNSHYMWIDVIKQDSPPVIILPMKEGKIFDELGKLTQKKFKQNIKQLYYHIMFPGTHVGWHNDGGYKSAVSIYLNDQNRNHGGLFLFEQNNVYGAVVPKRNLGIYQAGGVWHAVSALTETSPPRESIQIFMGD